MRNGCNGAASCSIANCGPRARRATKCTKLHTSDRRHLIRVVAAPCSNLEPLSTPGCTVESPLPRQGRSNHHRGRLRATISAPHEIVLDQRLVLFPVAFCTARSPYTSTEYWSDSGTAGKPLSKKKKVRKFRRCVEKSGSTANPRSQFHRKKVPAAF